MIKVKTHQIFKVTGQGHRSKVNIAGHSFAHFGLYLDNQLRYAKAKDIAVILSWSVHCTLELTYAIFQIDF